MTSIAFSSLPAMAAKKNEYEKVEYKKLNIDTKIFRTRDAKTHRRLRASLQTIHEEDIDAFRPLAEVHPEGDAITADEELFEAALKFPDELHRVFALMSLVDNLPTGGEAFSHARHRAFAPKIATEWLRAEFIKALIAHLPPGDSMRALADIYALTAHIENERLKAEVLVVIFKQSLSGGEHAAGVRLAAGVKDEFYRLKVLVAAAHNLPVKDESAAWRAIHAQVSRFEEGGDVYKSKLLVALADNLPSGGEWPAYKAALNDAANLSDSGYSAEVLTALAKHPPRGFENSARDAIRKIALQINVQKHRDAVLYALEKSYVSEEEWEAGGGI